MSARTIVLLGLLTGVVVGLMGCAHPAAPRTDWVAIDNKYLEARWRAQHCLEPNGQKCDALWFLKEEITALLQANREAFEREHQAELERLRP